MAAGVLTHQELIRLCGLTDDMEESDGTQGPIRPCKRQNVRSASYDLRLGSEYYLRPDDPKESGTGVEVSKLEPGKNECIVVPANRVVIVSVYEDLKLDDDIVGHVSLKVDVLLHGLIMSNQSQIDAGYSGDIFALLYNLSDETVTLKYKESILRLELVRLNDPTTRPYDGDYQDVTLAQALTRPIASSLSEMEQSVERARREVTRTRALAGFAAVVFGIGAIAIPLWLGVYGPLSEVRDRVTRLDERSARITQLEQSLQDAQTEINSLQRQLDRLNTSRVGP